MRKRLAIILVAVLVAASFAVGLLTPAKAAPAQPTAPMKANASSALVCLWVPHINIGLC